MDIVSGPGLVRYAKVEGTQGQKGMGGREKVWYSVSPLRLEETRSGERERGGSGTATRRLAGVIHTRHVASTAGW